MPALTSVLAVFNRISRKEFGMALLAQCAGTLCVRLLRKRSAQSDCHSDLSRWQTQMHERRPRARRVIAAVLAAAGWPFIHHRRTRMVGSLDPMVVLRQIRRLDANNITTNLDRGVSREVLQRTSRGGHVVNRTWAEAPPKGQRGIAEDVEVFKEPPSPSHHRALGDGICNLHSGFTFESCNSDSTGHKTCFVSRFTFS